MEDPREARRKRLVSRGTDRLAFITGQARSLPQDLAAPQTPTADAPRTPTAAVAPLEDDAAVKTQPRGEIFSSDVDNLDRKEPPAMMSSAVPKVEMKNEIPGDNNGAADPLTTSTIHTATGSLTKETRRVFTLKQLSRSISATENIRLLCSLVIALLIVLLAGSNINFGPLLLVLLTDATVVFGWMVANQETVHKGEEAAKGTEKQFAKGWTSDYSKMLEAALLFQNVMSAVSIDCSVCAVIMICGIKV